MITISSFTNPNSNMKIKVDSSFNTETYIRTKRRNYINQLINHENLSICPECGGNIEYTTDEDEYYCTKCGLVTQSSNEYVAGFRIDLPYGRR